MVSSLAWPILIGFGLILFRKKIVELLPRLRGSFKGLDVRFASADGEAVQVLLGQPALPPAPTPEETSKFDEVAKRSPRAAVLELSYELEEAIRGFAVEMGFDLKSRNMTLSGLIRGLRANDLIDEKTSALLDDLRVIANTAKHGHDTGNFGR